MPQVELIMPKMGESIMEATILKWVKQVGDSVELDETILEIATDKVDSEVPSPVAGVIKEIFFKEDDVVGIGEIIAMIATEGEEVVASPSPALADKPVVANGQAKKEVPVAVVPTFSSNDSSAKEVVAVAASGVKSDRFYSPLVKNIAKKEGISLTELEGVAGTGLNGRLTKSDLLVYIENRGTVAAPAAVAAAVSIAPVAPKASPAKAAPATKSVSGGDEIIEMDRMRRLIADHMVKSKQTSPHVTSFVEIDVTNIVNWRNKVKKKFQEQYGAKITFTPIFIEAVAKAIRDYPMINVSVDGTNIIVKKNINIGMAAALPSGNLIVPVIKNADQLNLMGLATQVADLTNRARLNKLKPEDIQGGTFTLTNVGTFGNLSGTPIINQPEVAIISVGAIKKKPAVLETEHGDVIAIRHLMFMSLSFDHRVVDGFLGGSFLRRVGDYLEQFDANRSF